MRLKKYRKLTRDEFFGHPDVLKLTNKINKKSLDEFSYIYIKDKKLIRILKENIDWLDFVGIILTDKDKRTICLKWSRFN